MDRNRIITYVSFAVMILLIIAIADAVISYYTLEPNEFDVGNNTATTITIEPPQKSDIIVDTTAGFTFSLSLGDFNDLSNIQDILP